MKSFFWLFFGLFAEAKRTNQIPDFGVFADFKCDSNGFDSIDEAKFMCRHGTNFVLCDLILVYKTGGRKKYFVASTSSKIKCSNKNRYTKVAWKGQFLLNKPLGQNRCIGPNDRSYENYSHLKTYETLNLAKIYCQKKFTDCNIIVEVSKENGLRKLYEFGKIDPEGCGMISQTQAEQGITLSVAYVADSALPTTTSTTTPTTTTTKTSTTTTFPEPAYELSESYTRKIKSDRKWNLFPPKWNYLDKYEHLISNLQDYAYIEIDASGFEKDANIEFGASETRSESQFRIILGGWNGKKSRIAAYNSTTETDSEKVTREHSTKQWKKIRSKIRVEINDGLIRVSTNGDGTWINTNQPFDLASQKINKQELTNMFIGIKGHEKGTMIVKLYKRTN